MKTKSADKLYCGVREEIIKSRSPILNYDSLRLFYEYIVERYKIHIKKDILKESAPYTDNTILRDYKFCNVRRDHDRSSKWLIDNVSSIRVSLRERIYKSIIYRLYNKVDTARLIMLDDLEFFGHNWLDRACSLIAEGKRNNSNYKFYTNAYKTGGTKSGMKNSLTWYYYQREVILKNCENKHSALLAKLEFYRNLYSSTEDHDKRIIILYQIKFLTECIKDNKYKLSEINKSVKSYETLPNKLLNKSIVPNLPLVKKSTIYSNNNIEDITLEYEVYDVEYKEYKISIDNDYLPLLFVSLLISDEYADKLIECDSQSDVYELLRSLSGCGNFIAYQLYVDLTYIDEFKFSENEFVVAGPGCYYGTELLMKDRYNFSGMTCEEIIFWLRDNLVDELKKIGIEFNPYELFSDVPEYDRCLNVMMIENCLCEYQKYYSLTKRLSGHVRKYKEYRKEI